MIERVTITGADDKVSHEEIIKISEQFHFVEWGILLSPGRTGGQRFPTLNWIKELKEKVGDKKIKFSAHLCGDYTKEMLETGDNPLIQRNDKFQEIGDLFKRVQLNFNASKHTVCEGFYDFIKKYGGDKTNFIIQTNKDNQNVCEEIILRQIPVHFLWDSSGGRGVANNSDWALPFLQHFTGYAGGLNPDNLKEKLDKFFQQSDADVWIDTESGVRTNNELDLNKVVKFLEIASERTECKEIFGMKL
jgi:phosphoribosylanthranilate isomerase